MDSWNPKGRPLNYKFPFSLVYDILMKCHVKPVLMPAQPVPTWRGLARPPHSAWQEGGPEPRDSGQAPGALHHIIAKGIERIKIFKDDTDRKEWLKKYRRLAVP